MRQPLTKSIFKAGIECPNKIKYVSNPSKYENARKDDPFLQAIAKGGFQVEELARMHFPGGVFINTVPGEYELAAELTNKTLEKDNAVIYEASFLANETIEWKEETYDEPATLGDKFPPTYCLYFVRTDILVKTGNTLKLIEVKAKSFRDEKEIKCTDLKWWPILLDLAFQKYVVELAFPDFQVEPYLMLVDKNKTASIDGLNQMFRVPAGNNPRTEIIKRVSSLEETGDSILTLVGGGTDSWHLETQIENVMNMLEIEGMGWEALLAYFNRILNQEDEEKVSPVYSNCKKCEFRTNQAEDDFAKCSGFVECFSEKLGWRREDFQKPNIFEIWNLNSKGSDPDGFLELKKSHYFLEAWEESDFSSAWFPEVKSEEDLASFIQNLLKSVNTDPSEQSQSDDEQLKSNVKLSRRQRQWLQLEKSRRNDMSIHIETTSLKNEMASWKFPLHFIDFETSAVALPFNKGLKPYDQVAFQFSHHNYFEDGRIEHKTEFINATPGVFPNFEFARTLKHALEKDNGTIFCYSAYENSVLNAIINQLNESKEMDAAELIEFLKSITKSPQKSKEKWKGGRSMVDLRKIILDYYYNPLTKGSNSIKYLLPAILATSKFLQTKYSKAIGSVGLTSKNFSSNHVWLEIKDGQVKNPYQMLPPIFDNWSQDELDSAISDMDGVSDGGAALIAYAKLQYQDMQEHERDAITKALLKYCELDTLAMVMIYEHLVELNNDKMTA